jgi:hypothetical protein
MTQFDRRHALLGLAALMAGAPSAANPVAREYAALSLIGDALSLLSYQPQTGSHLARSDEERLPLAEAQFDVAALQTIERLLKRAGVGGEPALIVPGGPAHYEKQREPFANGLWQPNPALRSVLPQIKASHLLLLTPLRSTGGLRNSDLPPGPRALTGIGFYLDPGWREKRGNALVEGSGLLAPFVSLRLSLIELPSLRIVAQQSLHASRSLPTPPNHRNPWDALPDAVKMAGLRELLSAELERVLPALLAAAG